MRRISSTTGVFYNSRAADARRGKVRGRGRSPALVIRTKGLYLLPAYDQQVEEGQHRRQGRSYVRKGRRGQDPPGASGLRARQYPVARQEPVGAGGSVDLDGQRHYVEEQNPEEKYDGHVDKERSQRARRATDEEGHDESQGPELAAKVHDREDTGPQLHRHVSARVLDRMPHLVGGHADPGDGTTPEVVFRQPDDLASRIIVVGELSGYRLYPDVRKTVAVEYHARRLGAGKTTRASLLRVLRVRAPHPQGRGPRDEHADDHY